MTYRLVDDLHAISKGFPKNDLAAWPHIPCPSCKRGGLTLVSSSLQSQESNSSASMEDQGKWHPGAVYGQFHFRLRCRKGSCDLVWVSGEMRQHPDFDDHGDHDDYYEHLYPKFFMPALPLVEIPNSCPKPVQDRIEAASKILWIDPSSAANRLRSATEALLDDLGIPKVGVDVNGKKRPVDLHKRIEKSKKVKPDYADAANLLLAVKWIGNVGSHEDSLGITDVLDGVAMLDFALELIYGDRRNQINRKAAVVIARKGRPDEVGGFSL